MFNLAYAKIASQTVVIELSLIFIAFAIDWPYLAFNNVASSPNTNQNKTSKTMKTAIHLSSLFKPPRKPQSANKITNTSNPKPANSKI